MLARPNLPPDSKPPEHFAYVDALRGIAVLLVIFVHTAYYMQPETVFRKIGVFGQYGVQLFFVMSAFTLCHSMNRYEALTAMGYKEFFARRFFRIAPMYYLGLVGYGIYTLISFKLFGKTPWTNPSEYSVGGVVSNFLFLHDLFPPGKPIVPGGWSIGCEFLFYAFFPPLFFCVRKSQWWLLPLIVFGFVTTWYVQPLYARLGWAEVAENNSFHYAFISNQIPCFALGILYFFKRGSRFFRLLIALAFIPSLYGLIIWHDHHVGWMLTPLCSALVSVGLAIALERFSTPGWLRKTGVLSFSLYMVHFIVVWNVCVLFVRKFPASISHSWSAILIFSGILFLSILGATLTHRFIENPCIAFGKRLIERKKQRGKDLCKLPVKSKISKQETQG